MKNIRDKKGRFTKGHPIFKNNPFTKGNKIGPRFKKGYTPWNKGRNIPISSETKIKISEANKGKKLTEEHKLKLSKAKKGKIGPLSNAWFGGLTPINKRIRNSQRYAIWRKKIMDRDNYTCVLCKNRGGNLEVDHIKPFSKFPKLRFSLSNGRTLCTLCHSNTDTYSYKLRWRQ